LIEEELDMKHCTKSLLTLALGLGLESAAFAQAPNESAKPKPSATAAQGSKAENHAQHVAKPEHAKLEADKTSQPMAAGAKSASPKPAGDKVMPEKSATKDKDKANVAAKSVSKTKKVSKPEASPELSKPASK
jgi:hypothetical protein